MNNDYATRYTIRARKSGLCDLFAPGISATTGTATATFRHEATAQGVADKLNAALDHAANTQRVEGSGMYMVLPYTAHDAHFYIVDPDGRYMATFADAVDAQHVANSLNGEAGNADALAVASTYLGTLVRELRAGTADAGRINFLAFAALGAVNNSPGRAVRAVATGPTTPAADGSK